MNKSFWQILCVIVFLISACTPSATNAPIAPTKIATSTPSPLPTSTQTVFPSATPTSSITPLPTIPTFTPTFDVSTIVTVTPAPKAECPKEDSSVVTKFATPIGDGHYEFYSTSDILDYLNSGGIVAQLRDSDLADIMDFTGDGVNEVGYRDLFSYSILGCTEGQYQDLLDFIGDFDADLGDVLDLNKNGIPEIILFDIVHYGYADIYI